MSVVKPIVKRHSQYLFRRPVQHLRLYRRHCEPRHVNHDVKISQLHVTRLGGRQYVALGHQYLWKHALVPCHVHVSGQRRIVALSRDRCKDLALEPVHAVAAHAVCKHVCDRAHVLRDRCQGRHVLDDPPLGLGDHVGMHAFACLRYDVVRGLAVIVPLVKGQGDACNIHVRGVLVRLVGLRRNPCVAAALDLRAELQPAYVVVCAKSLSQWAWARARH